MKKVSIIIAVYNSEIFLNRCLDSVLNQTLKDVEIIIVNDGSTDGSLKILKDYASIYSYIILLDQENSGYSAAINRGLNTASGEYIAFVDGDDYIEHDMIETLYKEAKVSDLDLVLCNWDRVDANGNFLSYNEHSDFENKIFDRNEILREFFLNKKELVEGYSWNKLIKRSLLNEFNIRYPNINYSDMPAIFKILTKVNKCKYINKTLYHYVQNNTSITHTKTESNLKNYVKAIQMVHTILMEENLISEFKEAYFIFKIKRLLTEYGSSREVIHSSEELTETFKTILQTITIKKCITLNRSIDFNLLMKVFLYRVGLLRISVVTYRKLKLYFN